MYPNIKLTLSMGDILNLFHAIIVRPQFFFHFIFFFLSETKHDKRIKAITYIYIGTLYTTHTLGGEEGERVLFDRL